jgi:hypothetical protein
MNTVHDMTDWAVVPGERDNPYIAPEVAGICLWGLCPTRAAVVGRSGDPTHKVYTTPVAEYDPTTRIATTRSGTRYRLVGDPAPDYAAWCKEKGYDPATIKRTAP